ncbi:hypothetical protein CEXT_617761 [Caerostris extrusa]|uniref:Uncharacterized protein n=1 Tax=Caerostris extrusa TaxID=172846 RepID=A0AAV4PIW1_CAEEX|nr:hypothetical protein CEXT_617761 [Caerostris extrusa]
MGLGDNKNSFEIQNQCRRALTPGSRDRYQNRQNVSAVDQLTKTTIALFNVGSMDCFAKDLEDSVRTTRWEIYENSRKNMSIVKIILDELNKEGSMMIGGTESSKSGLSPLENASSLQGPVYSDDKNSFKIKLYKILSGSLDLYLFYRSG